MGLGLGRPSGHLSAAPSTTSGGELALLPEGVAPPVFDDRILGATRGRCRTRNQATLQEDVELFPVEQRTTGFENARVSRHRTVDGDHGCIETRTTTAIHDIAWLRQRHAWPGLNAVVMIESIRDMPASGPATHKVEHETRLYITSLGLPAQLLGPIGRSHWAVENSLHRVLDMTFRDDECLVRTQHAPANLTTLKHMAHNLLRRAPGKHSLRLRRKVAAWDDNFPVSPLAA